MSSEIQWILSLFPSLSLHFQCAHLLHQSKQTIEKCLHVKCQHCLVLSKLVSIDEIAMHVYNIMISQANTIERERCQLPSIKLSFKTSSVDSKYLCIERTALTWDMMWFLREKKCITDDTINNNNNIFYYVTDFVTYPVYNKWFYQTRSLQFLTYPLNTMKMSRLML